MTKEEIEQYIELDNKIKNLIVQISHALKDVKCTRHLKNYLYGRLLSHGQIL